MMIAGANLVWASPHTPATPMQGVMSATQHYAGFLPRPRLGFERFALGMNSSWRCNVHKALLSVLYSSQAKLQAVSCLQLALISLFPNTCLLCRSFQKLSHLLPSKEVHCIPTLGLASRHNVSALLVVDMLLRVLR